MNILIVDDNAMNLKLLSAILEGRNHQVLKANDGEEALALMGEVSVDAVISDILMPKMDGYRLCYEVRRSERLKNLPFVFYSAAYTSPADEKLCMDLGADKYVRKPATSFDLFAALDEAIGSPHRQPSVSLTETDVLKQYSERLVDKLEEKNVELNLKAEELNTTHLKLRNLLAYSPAVIYTLDVDDGKLIPALVSDNMERLLGISGVDTSFDWWVSSLHPDDRDRIVEAKRLDIGTDGGSHEYRIRHVDGSYRWVQDSSRIVRDDGGQPTKLVGVWTDVTERKEVEAALQKSEERFREVLENVELVAVMLDTEANVAFCNDYFLSLTGWTREEVLGSSWFARFVPTGSEDARRAIFESLQTGEVHRHRESNIKTRSGEQRQIRWSHTALKDGAGNVTGIASIGEDVTERTLTSLALQKALDETERQVEERTAALALRNEELVAAREAADSANKSKSDFLSRMSHELRTPMNSILGFGQLLEFSDLDEGQKDSIDHILRAGKHLLKLINEVLEIARIEAGASTLSLEPVELAEVVEECVSLMRPVAIERGVSLSVTGRPSGVVTADRQRLSQVLLNLLSNGIKYNVPEGRVTIRVARQPNGYATVEVTDTGLGIPSSKLHKLFTPFERLGADSTGVEGTGLGLTLSKSLMEAMGGTLTVESKEGAGSTFKLRLELVQHESGKGAAVLQSAFDPGIWRGVKGRVLVIEDNLMNTQLLNRIFAQCPQIELVTAMQGRLGLELARDHPPDAILLDLHLPDMNGKEVLAELRADPNLHDVPVIIVTADAFSDHSRSLLEAGAFRYLTKPFVLGELIAAVATALGSRGEK